MKIVFSHLKHFFTITRVTVTRNTYVTGKSVRKVINKNMSENVFIIYQKQLPLSLISLFMLCTNGFSMPNIYLQ